jgi:hypothetical protein
MNLIFGIRNRAIFNFQPNDTEFVPENGKEAQKSQLDTPYDERLAAAGLRKCGKWICASVLYTYILTGSGHFDSNSF